MGRGSCGGGGLVGGGKRLRPFCPREKGPAPSAGGGREEDTLCPELSSLRACHLDSNVSDLMSGVIHSSVHRRCARPFPECLETTQRSLPLCC